MLILSIEISLLQSKMLPFDSAEAYSLNSEIFKLIKEKSFSSMSGNFGNRLYISIKSSESYNGNPLTSQPSFGNNFSEKNFVVLDMKTFERSICIVSAS